METSWSFNLSSADKSCISNSFIKLLFGCRMRIRRKVLTKITEEDVKYFLIEHDELQETISKVGSAA